MAPVKGNNMTDTNSWLEGWKALAEYRRQSLAQTLSHSALNPAARQLFVKTAENLVNKQQSKAEAYKNGAGAFMQAYSAHLKSLGQILSKASSNSTAASSGGTNASSKGSLGDTS